MKTKRGFTLIELLVVVTIIGILAGMGLGVMAKAKYNASMTATRFTVAKLADMVMQQYQTYGNRRVSLVYAQGKSAPTNPLAIAQLRLAAIRDVMRMEMPDCAADINTGPLVLDSIGTKVQPSALWRNYVAKVQALKLNGNNTSAKMLYLWLSTAVPASMGKFLPSEVRTNFDGDGYSVFVDAFGNPIGFLRWAPGASAWSSMQVADPTNHHDPFDPLLTDQNAYQLYPLVFAGMTSAGQYGITLDGANNNPPAIEPFGGNSVYAQVGAGTAPMVSNQN